MPQKKLTSVIDIVDKLVDVSIAIKNRGKLKDPEEARFAKTELETIACIFSAKSESF
ncbi:hypothetical protein H633G_11700 [Metarhizium anisopliae BRIP 53284]|nr:hypothetical protein H633G_11700 [Metarhizium anisopliae BRIP 53284]